MGSSHTSQKQGNREFGRIFIRTDSPFYNSGQIVTGNIYLYVQKDGFPGTRVFLKVSGKELCQWQETSSSTDSDGNSTSRTDIYKGKNVFYCHKIMIHQFQSQTLPQGQYSFPFQFSLMNHLPGSFFEKGGDYEGLIKYRVKAEIDSQYKRFQSIKDQQELVLREPLKTNIKALRGQVREIGYTCCCLDQGSCHIIAIFDKNHYLPGERAFLWIDIDNSNCQLSIINIEATLKNYLTLSDGRREKVITKVVNRSQIGGLLAGQKAIGNDRKQMQIQLVDQNSKQVIKPSSNGQLVKSVYQMSAKAILDSCSCCSTDPEVKVPINIIAPVIQDLNALPPEPQNWNPQVFDSQNIILNNQDLYVKSQNKGLNQHMVHPFM